MEQAVESFVPVYELFETSNWKTANDYIKLGWIMMKSYTTCYHTQGPLAAHQDIHYCLAWTESEKTPAHPKDTYFKIESALDEC